MGVEIHALVTDWEAAVAACREAGGLDFYWDTDELPYADEFYLPSGRRYHEVAVCGGGRDHRPRPPRRHLPVTSQHLGQELRQPR